jgi:bis(5'-nucleosyl)-tetraphosphatase (symmetrical)
MPTYAIGDVQGCFATLQKLLDKIQFDPARDVLWFTGDIVNRGPQSLETLRFVKSLGDKQCMVLGNHDLHLLAVYHGTRKPNDSDTFHDVLSAPDRAELIAWLQHQPLLVHDEKLNFVMTHAGIAPMWSIEQAKQFAHEVESVLQSNHAIEFFKNIYGNLPDQWSDDLKGHDRLRLFVNYFTRMRYCHPDGRLNLSYKGGIEHKPDDLVLWFDVKNRKAANTPLVFGHFAALNGEVDVPNVYALDTGCVWGNKLTCMRLEDREITSVLA